VVNAVKTHLTSSVPELWLYVLGALFVIITVFLPAGLIGLFGALKVRVPALVAPPIAPLASRRMGDD
jgi:urea transport system permease protein